MVGAKSLVHRQPAGWPNPFAIMYTHIAYACESK